MNSTTRHSELAVNFSIYSTKGLSKVIYNFISQSRHIIDTLQIYIT